MPAYPTHVLFAQMALQALADSEHPLAGLAQQHRALFRVASIAGCDVQCMPYQTCRQCGALYRHDQQDSRKCLVCGGDNVLEQFTLTTRRGRTICRREVEHDLYGNTHLVLYRKYRGYGVADPRGKAQGPEQPFPQQVVNHLAFCLMDADRVAGRGELRERYLAFLLGWFAHVISDAIFKGVYPHAASISFFGQQYGMEMMPAAETLMLTDISHDFGMDWNQAMRELLDEHSDGGALRHLAMGDPKESYGPQWTPEHGEPDERIGDIMDKLWQTSPKYFHRMYTQPDYSAASPALDQRDPARRADWRFGAAQMNLGQLRRYAMGTGWYQALIASLNIYLRAVNEAGRMAGYGPANRNGLGQGLLQQWAAAVQQAAKRAHELPQDWGSMIEVQRSAAELLSRWRTEQVDAQQHVIRQPPIPRQTPPDPIAYETYLQAKYRRGLAGMVQISTGCDALRLAPMSDFGEKRLSEWAEQM